MRSVEIKFGGIDREFRIELAAAPKFEAATGLGVFALYKAIHDRSVTTINLAETLRVAFAVNGANYTTEDIFKMIAVDGLIEAYAVAEVIIMQLFLTPEGTKEANAGKKSRPAGGRSSVSH